MSTGSRPPRARFARLRAGLCCVAGWAACAGWAGCAPAQGAASADGRLPVSRLRLPAGFHIAVYADAVPGARSMTWSPAGVLYVGTREGGKGRVYALPTGAVQGGRPQRPYIIASGLNAPNGVAWHEGALYVAELTRVLRFDGIDSRLENPPAPVVVSSAFPEQPDHSWKFIRFGPDGMLYVPVGAPCNICNPPQPIFASITRMHADGSGLEIFAHGVRNTVGFDWHPQTHELWFTDNGRDWMGDDRPPDELNHAPRGGLHFGYPFCHGRDIADPEFGAGHPCASFVPPARELPAHVAALGMRFYTGSMFPAEYRHQIFIAEHGSWNRSRKIGYRVSLVRLEGNRAVSYQPFVEGWLQPGLGLLGSGRAWGRPVDVQELPDGSLLVSDDQAGAIYRITYGR